MSTADIRIAVDVTNPGQFFASCGLLEFADRLHEGAEGWFEHDEFRIRCDVPSPGGGNGLDELVQKISTAELLQVDPEDNTASPILIGKPFRTLRLDWWHDEQSGGKELKVWAGSMESTRIARAMQNALRAEQFRTPKLFSVGVIVYDPDKPDKKVEPFYFDARRGPNAHSRDIGFSPNDLQLTTVAFPAVEFLCLVGLQRCLPATGRRARMFDYFAWNVPLPPALLPAAATGSMPLPNSRGFEFENWYRTGQRKHKAFLSAVPHSSQLESQNE